MVFFVSSAGCASNLYDYAFEVLNTQARGEIAVLLESEGGIHITFSRIVSKTGAVYRGPFEIPPNDKYTISWYGKDGNKYKASANLQGLIDKKYTGLIIFDVNGDNNLTFSAKQNHKSEEIFRKVTSGIKQ